MYQIWDIHYIIYVAEKSHQLTNAYKQMKPCNSIFCYLWKSLIGVNLGKFAKVALKHLIITKMSLSMSKLRKWPSFFFLVKLYLLVYSSCTQ